MIDGFQLKISNNGNLFYVSKAEENKVKNNPYISKAIFSFTIEALGGIAKESDITIDKDKIIDEK